MCMTIEEMNKAMEEIQEWKRIKEEAEDNISALRLLVIEFLQETKECEAVDKEGRPIRKFVGDICKATYSMQEQERVDKKKVRELLNDDDYEKVSKKNVYPVLRIV